MKKKVLVIAMIIITLQKIIIKNIKIFFTVKKIPNFLKNKNKKINFKILKIEKIF